MRGVRASLYQLSFIRVDAGSRGSMLVVVVHREEEVRKVGGKLLR